MSFPSILFLGAGQMAEALIRGVLSAGLVTSSEVMATDVRPERLELLKSELGIRIATDNRAALRFGRVILVAVKPQDVAGLRSDVRRGPDRRGSSGRAGSRRGHDTDPPDRSGHG